MANQTEGQTPGADFHTHITSKSLTVRVDFGEELDLSDEEAELLETNAHNAIELVVALAAARTSIDRMSKS